MTFSHIGWLSIIELFGHWDATARCSVMGKSITDPITRTCETLADALLTLWLALVTFHPTSRAVVTSCTQLVLHSLGSQRIFVRA